MSHCWHVVQLQKLHNKTVHFFYTEHIFNYPVRHDIVSKDLDKGAKLSLLYYYLFCFLVKFYIQLNVTDENQLMNV